MAKNISVEETNFRNPCSFDSSSMNYCVTLDKESRVYRKLPAKLGLPCKILSPNDKLRIAVNRNDKQFPISIYHNIKSEESTAGCSTVNLPRFNLGEPIAGAFLQQPSRGFTEATLVPTGRRRGGNKKPSLLARGLVSPLATNVAIDGSESPYATRLITSLDDRSKKESMASKEYAKSVNYDFQLRHEDACDLLEGQESNLIGLLSDLNLN